MSDRGDLLSNKTLDEASHRCYLNALAALHARYLDDPALLDPALGLCDSARYFTFLSPRVLSKIGKEGTFVESWDRVDASFAPETTRIIKSLHEDPGPLCAALQHFPQTFAHGDWAPRNLAIDPQRSSSVLAIDWQVAYCGVPTQDLFRYLVAEKVQVEPSVVGDFPESIHYYLIVPFFP